MCGKSTSCKALPVLLAALMLFAAWTDAARAWDEDETVGVVGSAAYSNRDPGSLTDDSGLGAAAADGAAFACGTDLALLGGGDLAGNLRPGPVTYGEVRFAFAQDRPLAVCRVTPARLRSLLELCLSHISVDERTLAIDRAASAFEGFPQVSGFSVTYDASAPPGERVVALKAGQGSLDLADDTTVLTLTSTEYLLAGGYGALAFAPDYTAAGLTECEALAAYIAAGGMEADYTEADRVTVIGVTDNSIAGRLGLRGLVLLVCVLAAVLFGSRVRRRAKAGAEDSEAEREFRGFFRGG